MLITPAMACTQPSPALPSLLPSYYPPLTSPATALPPSHSFQEILSEVGFNGGQPIDEAFFRQHISGRHNPEIAADLFPQWDEQRRTAFYMDKEVGRACPILPFSNIGMQYRYGIRSCARLVQRLHAGSLLPAQGFRGSRESFRTGIGWWVRNDGREMRGGLSAEQYGSRARAGGLWVVEDGQRRRPVVHCGRANTGDGLARSPSWAPTARRHFHDLRTAHSRYAP